MLGSLSHLSYEFLILVALNLLFVWIAAGVNIDGLLGRNGESTTWKNFLVPFSLVRFFFFVEATHRWGKHDVEKTFYHCIDLLKANIQLLLSLFNILPHNFFIITNLIHKFLVHSHKLHKIKFLYMFRAQSAHHQEVNDANCTYAASGIITCREWRHQRLHMYNVRWPPDDERIALETCRGI